MKKINLVLGFHNHQPVGNFDSVFEFAYDHSYKPFLDVYERHPKIKIALHYTGILFEWLAKNKPEYVKRLKKIATKGQVEMMTGGYYEPILVTIPDKDKIGQIQKLTKFVKDKTDYDATGIWLAERVWEPQLPKPIAEAGIEYTVIDDAHFKYSGLQEENLGGYYVTEHEGVPLNVFPISERMRYFIPFQPPEQTIEFLRSKATEDGDQLVVFADDGEKFGVWPDTFEHCYERGWLNQFFTLLEENSDWINVITFQEALQQLDPVGRVYLPTASYREMMEWALPVSSIKKYEGFEHWLDDLGVDESNKVFVRGGFWRNFLSKYPESNNLHKRMLWSSRHLEKVKKSDNVEKAFDHLYAGQCNCPYWHGVFGGLYLPHLRSAIYTELIKAENELDSLKPATDKKAGWVKKEVIDFDVDGHDELVVETDKMNLFFSPKNGASLFELDYKPKNINLLDTMTRREEGYHHKLYEMNNQDPNASDVASIHDIILAKEEGLENYLNYDWYRRSSFLDHFLREDTTIDTFSKATYGEQGDFVNQPFEFKSSVKNGVLTATFTRDGNVWCGGKFVPVSLKKVFTIVPQSGKLEVKYTIANMDDEVQSFWFGTEATFALLAGNAHDRYYKSPDVKFKDPKLASTGELANASEISLVDEWQKIQIDCIIDKETKIWRFPIETISMSEGGFERVYQSSVVFPNWKFTLKPKEKWNVTFTQVISDL